jgi:AcrR family transcriptional regulator
MATARIIALAFDPSVRTPDDATGGQILDAALHVAAASGFRNLTMDEVAARAGVGRMTLYRRFGSRQELVDALAVRECRRCLQTISTALDFEGRIEDRAAALLLTTLEVIRDHPLLARLARFEPEALVRELTRDGSAVLQLVHGFLVGLIDQAQQAGELPPGDPALAAELAVRLGASFVLMPQTVIPLHDPELARAQIRRRVAPGFLSAVAGGP